MGNINEELKDIMNKSIPRSSKHSVSNVLGSEPRTWYCPDDEGLPADDEPVMIRLVDWNQIVSETPEAIMYMEDMKVARYHSDTKTWTIEPPFPKYDYSPLSNMGTVKENAEVSHWSKLKEGELNSWQCRLKPLNPYSYLRLNVDSEHDEKVYLALIHAMNCIVRVGGEAMFAPDSGSELLEYYKVLCDLQAAMDGQISYSIANEIYFLLGELRAAVNQVINDAMNKPDDKLDTLTKNIIHMVGEHISGMTIDLAALADEMDRRRDKNAMDN